MRWKNIMKALRIKLTQSMASYTREETVNNRMTYPLPQYSTIIGALHSACGYNSYHEMNISVQGKYSSMQKETYTNHTLLNKIEDDRTGNLIWLADYNKLNTGYIRIAENLTQGCKFQNKKGINIYDEEKLDEYIYLKKKSKEDRKNLEYKNLLEHFRILAKGIRNQEVLYDIELVIHISAEDEVLNDIMNNINNFVCLGRGEDFIELQEIKEVELCESIDREYVLKEDYSMYVNVDRIESGDSYYFGVGSKTRINGSVYYVSKKYILEDCKVKNQDKTKVNKRRFFNNKIPCLYTQNVALDALSKLGNGVYVDIDESGEGYIVDLN